MSLKLLARVGLLLVVTLATNRWYVLGQEKAKQQEVKAPPILPELDRCVLETDSGRLIKPVSVGNARLSHHTIGNLRIRIDKNLVLAFDSTNLEKPRWKAEAPDDLQLVWLEADSKVIYFAGLEVKGDKQIDMSGKPARVRRLAIDSGKWLDEIVLDKPRAKEVELVESLVSDHGKVVILSAIRDDDKGFEGEGELVGYRVSCVNAGESRSLWTKAIASAGKVGRPGAALLWSARAPEKVRPNLQQLSFLGKDILVCAGPVEDVFCLESVSGKEKWRLKRLWDYERGFIGPSVWQHFMARGGEDENELAKEKDKKEKAKQEDAKDSGFAAIVAGPVVVTSDKAEKTTSIFVAVAKSSASHYSQYLSNCIVYELDEGGKPVAMATLPRMVLGSWGKVHGDGIVWACQNNSFVRMAQSANRGRGLGLGPGGPDCICHVDWYRQLSPRKVDAWLRSDPVGSQMALGNTHAFRVVSGGYVVDPAKKIYRFPISVIDLKNGADRELVLQVHFKGDVPEPKSNYSRSGSAPGKERWQTFGPYLLAITWLELAGDQLHIHLGMENWTRSLEFHVEDVIERARR